MLVSEKGDGGGKRRLLEDEMDGVVTMGERQEASPGVRAPL